MSATVRGDGPQHIGPFTVVALLDHDIPGMPVPEERFLARSSDGAHTVLLSTPLPGADPARFAAEAEASRYLLGPWSLPAAQLAQPGEPPWHARPYLPVLPLPGALSRYGGPLPEHTVRALGAALAETLAVVHGQALAHAGISPAAVLLAADGPRLGCFGAVRAASPDGPEGARSGLRGIESGSLPPEQAAGEAPGPAGDVYALGAVLSYAATGYTVPERSELPSALRSVLTACVSRDPANRPHAGELLDALCSAPPGRGRTGGAPGSAAGSGPGAGAQAGGQTGPVPLPTALDAPDDGRAAALLGPGWLPARLIAALAHQSSVLLAAEITPSAPPAPAAPATPPPPSAPAAPAAPATPPPPSAPAAPLASATPPPPPQPPAAPPAPAQPATPPAPAAPPAYPHAAPQRQD